MNEFVDLCFSLQNATLVHYSTYTEASLKPCMIKIANLILKSSKSRSQVTSVLQKYSRAKFCNVATLPCLTSAYITELPKEDITELQKENITELPKEK